MSFRRATWPTRSNSRALRFESGEGGIRTSTGEQSLAQLREVSTGILGDRVDGEEVSLADAQGARSSVVAASESVGDDPEDGVVRTAPEVALTVAPPSVPRAPVVEAVESALHAFGVGRLDIAFDVLRKLLAELKSTP